MKTSSWLRPLRNHVTGRRSQGTPHRPKRTTRLRCEALEDRTTPSVSFESAFAVGDSGEWARDIASDGGGNTYIAGIFNGTVNFNPAGATPVVLSSSGSGQDSFVAKYDAGGNCLWAVSLDGLAEGVAVDAAGSAVLVTGANADDAFVARLGATDGMVQWARQWGEAYGFDAGYDVAFDSSGNAFAAGRVNLTPGNINNNMDVYVAKYDAVGNLLWSKQIGGTLIDQASSLAVAPDGGVVIGGTFRGTMDFDPGSGTYSLYSGGRKVEPSPAGFVLKLTAGGTFAWASHFEASQWSSSTLAEVLVDGSGSVYAIGDYSGTVDFNPSRKAALNVTGDNDAFVVSLTPQGQYSWVRTFGGDSNFDVFGATRDSGGNLYITGSFRGTADFDPGSGVFSRTSAGEEDAFVLKLDSSGGFQWAATMGGAGLDRGQGVAVDELGNVYTAGLFIGQGDYDPDPSATYLLDADPGYAMFWLKMAQN